MKFKELSKQIKTISSNGKNKEIDTFNRQIMKI